MNCKEILIYDANRQVEDELILEKSKIENVTLFNSPFSELDKKYIDLSEKLFSITRDIIKKNDSQDKMLIQLVIISEDQFELSFGLGSLFKTVSKELTSFDFQIIQIDEYQSFNELLDLLDKNSDFLEDKEIFYEKGHRYVKNLEEKSFNEIDIEDTPWREDGIYLITGGAGALGLIFAEEITSKLNSSHVILVGRSNLSIERKKQIELINARENSVTYYKLDICDKNEVQKLINTTLKKFGRLTGIIHAAGVINDSLFLNKDAKKISNVLGPKVSGLYNLDESTKNIDLDFMVLFSSGVAELGNLGQSDYGVANSFLDEFASYRNSLVEQDLRFGKTVSLDWPLWSNGGMGVDSVTERAMFNELGMVPMDNQTGIESFYKALCQKHSQVLVMKGNINRFKSRLKKTYELVEEPVQEAKKKDADVSEIITKIVASTIKIDPSKFDSNKTFDSYGINSVHVTEINRKLLKLIPTLSNTLLFECQNLDELIIKIKGHLGKEDSSSLTINECPKRPREHTPSELKDTFKTDNDKKTKINSSESIERNRDNDIAIIGMSGRFSKAENLNDFNKLLKSRENPVLEIPNDRWDKEKYFVSKKEYDSEQDKSYSKWGFFLKNPFNFDPIFFNVSPITAKYMDPQERLFLEECWKAVTDSGYTKERIRNYNDQIIGVYGAITKTGFNLWNPKNITSFSSMVNRFSYFMNFRGPSIPVDTMCSSSIVAINQACKDILSSEADMAVVGGVNLYLHPSNYINLSQNQMISDNNRNAVLANDAVGFTPSEGAGAIVLKRLSDAEKDKDDILAVIKGSSVKHSGKTSGYNIPDPEKQYEVINDALEKSNLKIEDIDHIEISANGSKIADDIEISALSKLIGDGTPLSIGSLKSVIGNGEAVSGIAQVIKSVMEIREGLVFPSSVSKNDISNLKSKGLEISKEVKAFNQKNAENAVTPKKIGINSFGAGGVYSHLIIEEYINKEETLDYKIGNNVFLFSARTKNALYALIQEWKKYLIEKQTADLSGIAYTLQMNREHMDVRYATVSNDVNELVKNLSDFINKKENENNFSSETREQLSNNVSHYHELANSWVNFKVSRWDTKKRKNVSLLPTYEFCGREFPIEKNSNIYQKELPTFPELDDKHEKNDNIFISIEEILQYRSENTDIKAVNNRSNQEINKEIKKLLYKVLFLSPEDAIDEETSFYDLGIDSILTEKFIDELNESLNLDLSESVLFSYTNISTLSEHILSTYYLVRER